MSSSIGDRIFIEIYIIFPPIMKMIECRSIKIECNSTLSSIKNKVFEQYKTSLGFYAEGYRSSNQVILKEESNEITDDEQLQNRIINCKKFTAVFKTYV